MARQTCVRDVAGFMVRVISETAYIESSNGSPAGDVTPCAAAAQPEEIPRNK